MEFLKSKLHFVDATLKGVGQIMLQENVLTGILFLAGIFYDGITMGLAAILAAVCGTLTAKVLGYDKEEIQKGLYGFSAALVGVALTFYFQAVLMVWVAIVIGSALAAVLQHLFIIKKITVFTLPFVLVAWGMIYLFHSVYPVGPSVFLSAKVPVNSITSVTGGYGQVIFQGSIFAGVIFLIGVLISAPVAALYGVAGAALAAVLSSWFGMPAEGIGMGLFGYNAVLCAITFSGKKWNDILWALIAVTGSVLIYILMVKYNFTALTFPFVAASCITLFVKRYFAK
jgi:urea transporter